MKNICLAAFAVMFASGVFGQSMSKKELKKLEHEAHTFFISEYYQEAKAKYLDLLAIDSTNSKYNYFIGVSILRSIHEEKALPYLQAAINSNFKLEDKPWVKFDVDRNRWISNDLNFNVARALHLHHEFQKAIVEYQKAKDYLIKAHHGHHMEVEIAAIDKFVKECKHGIKFLETPRKDVTVKNMGPEINSEYEEITPVVSADEKTIIFTSRRPGTTGGTLDVDGKYAEDIYISHKTGNVWCAPELISTNINTDEHDAAVGISPDGHNLLLYKNNHHNTGDIYLSELSGETWSTPTKLKDNINSKEFESSASISADENYIFFTSTREGGYGGEDIYVAYREDDHWGGPVNLGPEVNTEYDDDAPFIHPDGKTLYFSSKGHSSMGGFDIFTCTFNSKSKTCTNRENMGYPINSAEDDIFFVWSPDGKRAYYSSHHEDSYGDKDIYMMSVPDAHVPVILLYGYVKSKVNGTPIHAQITVKDLSTGDVVASFESNSHTGRYTVVLPPGTEYAIHVENAHFLSASKNINLPDKNTYYEEEVDFELEPLNKGSIAVLNNVFFENNKTHLDKKSFAELDHFVKLMQDNENLYVEIAGHTEIGGRTEYNLKLSQGRAEAVKDYFVKQGIDIKRLHPVGYGDHFPMTTEKTEEARQKNRRVEMIVHDAKVEGEKWEPYYSDKITDK